MTAATRGLSRAAVAVPVSGALLLVLAAAPVLADWSETVLRGAVVLLALAAAAAVDEPSAQLLDASPTPFGQRVLLRLAAVVAVVVPAAVLAALWSARGSGADAGQAALELCALSTVALAVAASLRRWAAIAEPAVLTGPLVLGGLLIGRAVAGAVPDLDLPARQVWLALLLLAGAVATAALRDPATAVRRRPRRPGTGQDRPPPRESGDRVGPTVRWLRAGRSPTTVWAARDSNSEPTG
jgi:hypothetical protein